MTWLNRIFDNLQQHEVNSQCPVCKKFSKQSSTKRDRGQAVLCPHCKSLFIMTE
ncbi:MULTISPECIES: YnfU family zinc-binding protein [Pantoea]|jgi:hypothetical protein|uniref:YnfU family zinc-binding protein n=1 Tax=Pantoea TaxID=53335 RepID=UPI001C062D1B|nr:MULTISPECIES: YnfU family zinc-binding protein [Pantoea]